MVSLFLLLFILFPFFFLLLKNKPFWYVLRCAHVYKCVCDTYFIRVSLTRVCRFNMAQEKEKNIVVLRNTAEKT